MRKSVAVGCILSILVPAIVLAGCGGGGSGSETPEQAAKAFFAAYQNQDADTVWSMLASNTRKEAGSNGKADLEKLFKEYSDLKFTVGEVTVDGDKATAEVTATVSGDSGTQTIPLVKEDGVWKVDMANASDSSTD